MKLLVMTSLWGRHGGKEHLLECCIAELLRQGHACVLGYSRLSSRPPMIALPAMPEYQLPGYEETRSNADEEAARCLEEVLRREAPDAIFLCDLRNLRMLDVLHRYGGVVTMAHDNWLTCMRGLATSYFSRHICDRRLDARCLLRGCFVRKSPVDGSLLYNSLSDHQAMLASYRRFGTHVVASHYMRDRLLLNGFLPEQVSVVGYFTDLEPKPRPAPASELPIILFTGRIDRYKGVDFLLHALTQIAVPFRCRIVGDGPQLPFCRKLCTRLGLDSKVDFLGWQPRAEVEREFLKSTVLAVTPLWPEPFGLIGLEAGVCGIPVVAFDTGGISEWLHDCLNGFLVPVKRTDLLAEKLSLMLQDPERARMMGAAGRQVVQTDFSREAFFQRFLPVLQRAASERMQTGSEVQAEPPLQPMLQSLVQLQAKSSEPSRDGVEVRL